MIPSLMKLTKKLGLLILVATALTAGTGAFAQDQLPYPDINGTTNYFEIKKAYEKVWQGIPEEKRKGWKQFKRWEYFWDYRVDKNGEFPDVSKLIIDPPSLKKGGDSKLTSENEWELIGPVGNPQKGYLSSPGIGRVNVLRIHPVEYNHIWAGTAFGGIWRSYDGGDSWENLDFNAFLSLGISDIAFSRQDPNIVYVATGDADGSYGSTPFYSVGLIKTSDCGKTWKVTNLSFELENAFLISRILVHPLNDNIVIVGTSNGVYKTKDGGVTWENHEAGVYIRDMEFMPSDANYIYASSFSITGNTRLYRSTDCGETWEATKSLSSVCRTALAVTIDNSNNVYAVCSNTYPYDFHSFLKSKDRGKTWLEVANYKTHPNILGRYNGDDYGEKAQGFYDLAIAVSPFNEDEIYVGGIEVWNSTNGGISWEKLTGSGSADIHVDHHDLVFPKGRNILYCANDGGLDKSVNQGQSWTNVNENMSITQFYRMGLSVTNPELIIGGAQDNGTYRLNDGTWTSVGGGDGMECAIDPEDPNIQYNSIYYGSINRTMDGDVRFRKNILRKNKTEEEATWVTPFTIDPNNPSTLYAGHQNVWKLTNYGDDREKISEFNSSKPLTIVTISPTDPNVIYAATPDIIHVTYDGGKTWTDIPLMFSRLTYIAVDPNNPRRFWATHSGFEANEKVTEYDGDQWKNISGNLPNIPVNCIVHQKDSPDRLYIGTDIGVYYSDYNSAHWEKFGSGMPNVIVNEMEIHYPTKKLVAATFGRGMWKTDLNNCNLPSPKLSVTGPTEFCNGDSCVIEAPEGYESYLWSNGETGRTIIAKENGAYSVAVPDNDANNDGCIARSEAVIVTVKTYQELTIDCKSPNPICEGEEASLSARLGFSDYVWSNGETGRTITVSAPGEYSVEAMSPNDCLIQSEKFELRVSPPPAQPVITIKDTMLVSTESQAYQWYFNDEEIDGANERELAYKQYGVGSFKVEVTVGYDCSEMSEPFVVTGVEEENGAARYIIVHPNPGRGIFYLDINYPIISKVELTISNVAGMNVMTKSFIHNGDSSNNKIDLTSAPAGVYLLKVVFDDKSIVKRIIKEQ